ncbi:hypothetical protein BJV77DRAFT_1161875 [Russula vinacea]|nr:hypothetical protein BJV77DRAFT_1161875 [Russula vinacea]
MAAASIYTTRVSGDEYLHRPSSPTTSLSPTLVNNPHHIERPSHKLRIPSGASDILNSVVVNAAGQSLYSITSNSKRTIWSRARTMSKLLPYSGTVPVLAWFSANEYIPAPFDPFRMFTHGDAQFTWTQGSSSGYLIPANRPGLSVAQWYINSRTDELILEVFQESPVEPDLFEAIVLSVVLLRSGRSFGDSPEDVLLMTSPFVFRTRAM